MVTSNAKQADGSIIPRINFSVPKNLLRPLASIRVSKNLSSGVPRNKFSTARLVAYMKSLNVWDNKLQALWDLQDVEGDPDLSHEITMIVSKL